MNSRFILSAICFWALIGACGSVATGQAGPVAVGQNLHAPDGETPLAWYLLQHPNSSPLLEALSHRIRPTLAPSRRGERMWTGEESSGRLRINIETDGEEYKEVFVGFFADAQYSAEPLQVRRFAGKGEYLIDDLPPGEYVLGALAGYTPRPGTVAALMVDLMEPESLGVHDSWSAPVSVVRSRETRTRLLVAKDFRHAAGWARSLVETGRAGKWKAMQPSNMLSGVVLGADDEPVSFSLVLIREYNPGAGSIAAPNIGANVEGKFFYDEMKWPYSVYASSNEHYTEYFGSLLLQKQHPEVLEGAQRVDFRLEEYPRGTAAIEGRFLDQHDEPVENALFRLDRYDTEDDSVRGRTYFGFSFPFMTKDGSFRVENLAPGSYKVRAVPFDYQVFEFNLGEAVVLKNGETTRHDIRLVRKVSFYGRVAFADGSPAVPDVGAGHGVGRVSLWSNNRGTGKGDLDRDGYFRVYLADRELESLEYGESQLSVSYPDPNREGSFHRLGNFPLEMLSTSREEAQTLTVQRPSFEGMSATLLSSLSGKPTLTHPISIDLRSVTGKQVDLEDYRGKVVLLNIFATWCGPCRSELPHLIALHEELAGEDFAIVSISRNEDAEAVEDFVKEEAIPFTVLIDSDGLGTRQFTHGKPKMSIPTNYLLDRDLNPVYVTKGYSQELFAMLRGELDKLLAD